MLLPGLVQIIELWLNFHPPKGGFYPPAVNVLCSADKSQHTRCAFIILQRRGEEKRVKGALELLKAD